MKKTIALLLSLVMLCSLMTGCGGDSKKEEEVKGGKLKVGIPQNIQITDYDENAFTKYAEEKTGVEIEFVHFSSSSSEYQQQLALMASGGEELPDVLMGFTGLGSRSVYDYGQEGYFVELNDLIDKYGKTYKKQLGALSEEVQNFVKQKVTDPDTGSIYAMPMVTQTIIDASQSLMFINQKWLDAVGMKAPTTIEELETVLKAFATKDPNGNGSADEIGMLGGNKMMDYIINAFIYYEEAHPYNIDDKGMVYAPFTTQEYRDALIYMNKLCEEGLYSDLSFTITTATELKNLYTPTSGVATVGIAEGHPSTRMNTLSPLVEEYTALAPLADATGKGGYIVVSEDIVTLAGFITSDCENKALAMKFLDFFYEDETVTRLRHGEKGVDWEVGSGMDIYGNEVTTVVLNGQAFFEGTQTWGKNVLGIHTPLNYNVVAENTNESEARVAALLKPVYEFMNTYPLKEETARNFEYTSEEDTVKEKYETTINNYVKEQANLFVKGTIDPNSDADWNAYLNQIEEIGLTKVLEIKQAAYDRTYGE